ASRSVVATAALDGTADGEPGEVFVDGTPKDPEAWTPDVWTGLEVRTAPDVGGGIELGNRSWSALTRPALTRAWLARSAQIRARFGANGMSASASSATLWYRFETSFSRHFSTTSARPSGRFGQWFEMGSNGLSRIAAQSSVMDSP